MNQHKIRYPVGDEVEIIGPIVIDLPPQLWSGAVTPEIGTANTTYTFNVLYDDFEQDQPIQAKVIIDNHTFDLTESENSDDVNYNSTSMDNSGSSAVDPGQELKKGIYFTYSTKLDIGTHSYYFLFQSGEYIIRYPGKGYLSGPLVKDEIEESDDNSHKVEDDTGEENVDNDKGIEDDNSQKNTTVIDDPDIPVDIDMSDPFETEVKPVNQIVILNFSVVKDETSKNDRFDFMLTCRIPMNFGSDFEGWLKLDDRFYQMHELRTDENELVRFNISLNLSPGDHYYHFVISSFEPDVRLPYKGEFRILINSDAEDTDEETEPFSNEGLKEEDKRSAVQLLFIALLILSVLYFSFYRKYIDLRYKK